MPARSRGKPARALPIHRWWAMVSGADLAPRPPSAVLLLEMALGHPDGLLLTGYDADGGRVTDTTRHASHSEALGYARAQHAPADVDGWVEITDDVEDAVQHALLGSRRLR